MSFSAQINAFGVDTEEKMRLFVATVIQEITTGVLLKTPVDTGRARANWFPSLDAPINTTTQSKDPTGSTARAAASGLAPQAAGRIFYLTNNLPYIRHLEYGLYGNPPGSANGPRTVNGYSKQAPAGMVRVTINEVVRHYS